jgi:hypothetical protein
MSAKGRSPVFPDMRVSFLRLLLLVGAATLGRFVYTINVGCVVISPSAITIPRKHIDNKSILQKCFQEIEKAPPK